jgi:hypothetical protein
MGGGCWTGPSDTDTATESDESMTGYNCTLAQPLRQLTILALSTDYTSHLSRRTSSHFSTDFLVVRHRHDPLLECPQPFSSDI